MRYMLFPFIVLILGLISVVIAKKNEILSDKKAVFYVLLSSFFFSLFGLFGFFGIEFMPYVYLFVQFLLLLFGFVNYKLLMHFIPALKSKTGVLVMLIIALQFFIGWALFSMIFNLANELQYGFWAGTCLLPVLFYPLFYYTYKSYLKIPAEIFKMKVYKASDVFEPPHAEIDVAKLMVCEIQVEKYINDTDPIKIKGKTIKSFVFSDWFGMIISDYNQKKAEDQVELVSKDDSYGWIFYTERSFMKSRRYLDPDFTFEANNLDGTELVIAKRVKNNK